MTERTHLTGRYPVVLRRPDCSTIRCPEYPGGRCSENGRTIFYSQRKTPCPLQPAGN
jgi:hypothetical protein